MVKAKIVIDYFTAWSRVMKNHWKGSIGYIDLFCGPGVYANGGKSVPIMLLEKVCTDKDLAQRMRFYFNDENPENTANLKFEIGKMPGTSEMLKKMVFKNNTITKDFADTVSIQKNIPMLSFVDPWGYKGLTMHLVEKLIDNSGSECIFFFNYNRINMALSSNTLFDEHLAGIFGVKRTASLKTELALLTSAEHREQVLLNEILTVLMNGTGYFVLGTSLQ